VHFWYLSLTKRIPSKSPRVIFVLIFLDQAFFAPIFLPTYMLNLMMLEGKAMPDAIKKLQVGLKEALVTNWILWIPAQVVNFSVVPQKFQVLFSNFVAFAWTTYISWKTQKS